MQTGEEAGLRTGLLAVLASRGLHPDAAQAARIDGADAALLRAWLGRAALVATVGDLIGG